MYMHLCCGSNVPVSVLGEHCHCACILGGGGGGVCLYVGEAVWSCMLVEQRACMLAERSSVPVFWGIGAEQCACMLGDESSVYVGGAVLLLILFPGGRSASIMATSLRFHPECNINGSKRLVHYLTQSTLNHFATNAHATPLPILAGYITTFQLMSFTHDPTTI